MSNYDFSGWATRNDVRCSDGRTIRRNAFKCNDGEKVPLVWNHGHKDIEDVIGHCLLKNEDEGVYMYGYFNDTEKAQKAKIMVQHGDLTHLSIYANQLQQNANRDVLHGVIREVSLVMAGANPGAWIDNVTMAHGENSDVLEEAIIYGDDEDTAISLYHSDEETENQNEDLEHAEESNEPKKEDKEMAENNEKTIIDIYNDMTDEQKDVVTVMVGQALADAGVEIGEDGKIMKHNAFDTEDQNIDENVLTHAESLEIIGDAKRYGSMKESALQHGIEHIDYLFPEAKNVTTEPQFISRDMDWVSVVMNGVHNTPFSRIKSVFADITEDEARARGYIKGKKKVDEVFGLLKRSTSPTTVYKKQKMDRDDVVDITDFDVIAWLKKEMRFMLNEEIARAILVGDGRLSGSDDKINPDNIRPIWTDADLYTIKSLIDVPAGSTLKVVANEAIDQAVRARIDYKGSGTPTLFAPESVITECLLLKDNEGKRLYKTIDELATAMRVSKIVSVPIMEGLNRTDSSLGKLNLFGIIVNLKDYNVGADKGGAVSMFDDFDIDYNAQKYLIETRCSGALIKPYSAIALEYKASVEAAG